MPSRQHIQARQPSRLDLYIVIRPAPLLMYALHIPEVRVGGASGDAFYTHLIFRGRCRPFVVLLLLLTTETSHLRESLEGHQVETAVVSHGARHAFCLYFPQGLT